MATVQIPHNFHKPTEYQRAYLASDKPFSILVWHRRARKTRTALNKQVMKIMTQPRGVYYYVLPTYRQAKAVIWDSLVKDHVPDEIVDKKNDSELAIYYKNGSIQRFVGAEDPDKHRGTNPIDVVFDEYSEMSERLWTEIFQPVLRENKGTATFVYTPKGKNHSWKLLQLAKQQPDRWYSDVQNVHDTKMFTPDEIEEIKLNTPMSLYQQEYECSFLESASSFFRRTRENTYEPEDVVEPDHQYQLGIDLAKYQDWTVITPFDLHTFKVLPQDRFNQIDWNLQKARIGVAYHKYNRGRMVVDATGVGDPIAEDLNNQGMQVEPFKFTEQSKRELLTHLSILLEQDKIKIPNDEELLAELDAIQWGLSDNGKTKITTVEGMTDDRVMSLALAVWGHHAPLFSFVDDDVSLYNNDYL
jgi:hypothetical protein